MTNNIVAIQQRKQQLSTNSTSTSTNKKTPVLTSRAFLDEYWYLVHEGKVKNFDRFRLKWGLEDLNTITSSIRLGGTILHVATELNNLELVQYLVRRNPHFIDVNTQVHKNGWSPLHIAAKDQNLTLVSFYLTHVRAALTQPTLVDRLGQCALDRLRYRGLYKVILQPLERQIETIRRQQDHQQTHSSFLLLPEDENQHRDPNNNILNNEAAVESSSISSTMMIASVSLVELEALDTKAKDLSLNLKRVQDQEHQTRQLLESRESDLDLTKRMLTSELKLLTQDEVQWIDGVSKQHDQLEHVALSFGQEQTQLDVLERELVSLQRETDRAMEHQRELREQSASQKIVFDLLTTTDTDSSSFPVGDCYTRELVDGFILRLAQASLDTKGTLVGLQTVTQMESFIEYLVLCGRHTLCLDRALDRCRMSLLCYVMMMLSKEEEEEDSSDSPSEGPTTTITRRRHALYLETLVFLTNRDWTWHDDDSTNHENDKQNEIQEMLDIAIVAMKDCGGSCVDHVNVLPRLCVKIKSLFITQDPPPLFDAQTKARLVQALYVLVRCYPFTKLCCSSVNEFDFLLKLLLWEDLESRPQATWGSCEILILHRVFESVGKSQATRAYASVMLDRMTEILTRLDNNNDHPQLVHVISFFQYLMSDKEIRVMNQLLYVNALDRHLVHWTRATGDTSAILPILMDFVIYHTDNHIPTPVITQYRSLDSIWSLSFQVCLNYSKTLDTTRSSSSSKHHSSMMIIIQWLKLLLSCLKMDADLRFLRAWTSTDFQLATFFCHVYEHVLAPMLRTGDPDPDGKDTCVLYYLQCLSFVAPLLLLSPASSGGKLVELLEELAQLCPSILETRLDLARLWRGLMDQFRHY